MEDFSRLRRLGRYRTYSKASGAAAILIGGLTLLGWQFEIGVFKSLFPGMVAMNPVTAVAFILAGAALSMYNAATRDAHSVRMRQAASACALVILILACLRLAGYMFGWDIGIDRWLFSSLLDQSVNGIPNRMAPNTAMNFVFLGAALLTMNGGRRRVVLAQVLSLLVGAVAVLALLGYAYGARQFYGVALFIPMAANTAMTFFLLSTGLLCANADRGIMDLLTEEGAAGRTTRRLLPTAILVPSVFGWLRLRGQAAGLYGTEFGTSMMATAIILVFMGVIYWNARLLHEAERKVRESEEALRKSHDALEMRVNERTAELATANKELRREMHEKGQLQSQLIQSQKMDAVGRLAGGVAHDFNNLLTAIGGYSHFLLASLAADDKRREDVEQIKKAGERASSLTRQLLAFSRQQVLQMKVLDCNALVSDMEKMLNRIIGEDVELSKALSAEAGHIKADPGQIEQVLLNLVVNAKDAMPKGGKITIETSNVELGEDYSRMHLQVKPGAYVMLAVSDTGSGMDANTLSHLFEPFFTTKEQGKGTGLGLATVYGIVKQSGGGIYVYSEPGQGSIFKCYFPRVADAVPASKTGVPAVKLPTGSETLLLVEDDELVRQFINRALKEIGYSVLVAQDPAEALRLAEQRKESIHLILTDVIMPQMHGPKLVKRLSSLHPESRVVYMSGYTDTTVAHRDLVGSGVPFLQKPLSPDVLARKIREVLDAPI